MATKTLKKSKPHRTDPRAGIADARNSRIRRMFATATQNHSRGNRVTAEKLYRQVLHLDPKNVIILQNLGLLLSERGRHEQALDFANKALELAPKDPEVLFLQGNILRAMKQNEGAAQAYLKIIEEINPNYTGAYINLGAMLHQTGMHGVAENFYRKALEIEPRSVHVLACLAIVLKIQDKRSEAAQYFEKVLQLDPRHKQARHFFAALSGEDVETAPREYVAGLFDHYAKDFDEHLTGLRYKTPRLLREAVGRALGVESASWRILDLGCGTGLCGPLFRSLAGRLVGVDLSPRMLDEARKREVYDKLIEGDLAKALRQEKGTLDLAISADVLIYVGKLEEVFKACRRALREGGYFAFSTESFGGEGILLRTSGRFAHSDGYIMGLAGKNGFTLVLREEIVLRMEAGKPLSGYVYVLCKGEMAPQAESRPADSGPAGIEEICQEAFLHHQAGHVEQAEVLYRQILQLEPDNAAALHGLGVLAHETGHHEAAVELISEAIRKNPSLASYHTNLGLAYYAQGKMEEAVGAMKKALELNPDAIDTHINLANLLKLQGKLEEAEGHYRKAVALFPRYAEAHNNLAVVLYEQGKMEEAENHYRRATDLAPEYADGMRNMAHFLRKRGRFAEAAKYYKRLVKLRPGDEEARRRLEECEAQAGQP